MNSMSRLAMGWQPFFEQQLTVDERAQYIPARVLAHHGNQVLFQTESGEWSLPVELIRGRPNAADSSIAVGDWFLLDPLGPRCLRRLHRKTQLYRMAAGTAAQPQWIAANVDTIFIVSSCNADFNLSRLERYLALILEAAAVPVVVLTKADLCEHPDKYRHAAGTLYPGLLVESLDSREARQTTVLERWCGSGQTVAMLGSSGVGKSTLANTLCGLEIKTAGIREDDAKGRHTTTSRALHRLRAGGWLIDNPGMRELQLPACEQGVDELYEDILRIASNCKYRDCQHQGDAGCAVAAAVASGELDSRRLENYLKLRKEQSRNAASLAERREQDRRTGKMYKQIVSAKQRRRRG